MKFFPPKLKHFPNDKLTKRLINIPTNDNFLLVEGSKRIGNNSKKVFSPVVLSSPWGIVKLEPFDVAILKTCVSLQIEGFSVVSTDIIYRHLTGAKKDCGDAVRKRILLAIDRLMCTKLDIDLTDLCNSFHYGPPIQQGRRFKLVSPLLPVNYSVDCCNGQQTNVISFSDPSPIKHIAELKGQILSVQLDLLAVPIRNDIDTIVLKDYLLSRILEIKAHNLSTTITLHDIFDKCCFAHIRINHKYRVYDKIKALFKLWIDKNFIKAFDIVSDPQSRSITAFKIIL